MTKQYVMARIEKSVHKRLRKWEKDGKLDKNISLSIAKLLDEVEKGKQ